MSFPQIPIYLFVIISIMRPLNQRIVCLNLLEDMVKNNFVLAIKFDLTWTFDTVEKTFLASNPSAVGNRGPINQLFVSFLEDRKFKEKK